MKPQTILAVACVVVFIPFAFSSSALAQTSQGKVIRIVNPFVAGGNTDVVTRALIDKLIPILKQPMIIENRPGAMTNIASEYVIRSAPDGTTMLMGGASNAINMSFMAKPPYDTLRDFEPVILCYKGANVLSVHPSLPVKNLKELIALAKAKPGQLNYASSGVGTIVHLNAEFFRMIAGVDLVHVPYKGTALSIPDIANGSVAMLFDSLASVMPHIRSGKVKPLALNAGERSPLIPEVPTLAEAGMPQFDRYTWFGIFAPAGTPRDIVGRVQAETVAALKSPDLLKRFADVGAEPVGSTPEQFVERIRSDTARWAEVIRAANVKVQ